MYTWILAAFVLIGSAHLWGLLRLARIVEAGDRQQIPRALVSLGCTAVAAIALLVVTIRVYLQQP